MGTSFQRLGLLVPASRAPAGETESSSCPGPDGSASRGSPGLGRPGVGAQVRKPRSPTKLRGCGHGVCPFPPSASFPKLQGAGVPIQLRNLGGLCAPSVAFSRPRGGSCPHRPPQPPRAVPRPVPRQWSGFYLGMWGGDTPGRGRRHCHSCQRPWRRQGRVQALTAHSARRAQGSPLRPGQKWRLPPTGDCCPRREHLSRSEATNVPPGPPFPAAKAQTTGLDGGGFIWVPGA